jgi:hypothetical protein
MKRNCDLLKSACLIGLSAISTITIGTAAPSTGRNMMDYYLPMPIYDKLEKTGIWGAPGIIPREVHNGIEDSTCKKYSYWDGTILKGSDNKYHLYCSRWNQSAGHNGWGSSIAVHAVSDSITGPYIDKGPLYTWNNSAGHNVTAIKLLDGRYAVLVSETVPASIFIASDPNGPFEYQGHVEVDKNGHNTGNYKIESNMSICIREDGSYMIVTRDGFVMHSTKGILGPYLIKTDRIWPMDLPGYNTFNWEDPVLWRTGSKYYCTVNSWSSKKAIYMTSADGFTNWKYAGEAYTGMNDTAFRYTDGTKNKWTKLERPGIYQENGILKYLTFAAIDVEKDQDQGNDNHNSKVIVVPFDGARFEGITSIESHRDLNDQKKGVVSSVTVSGSAGSRILTIAANLKDNPTSIDVKLYNVNGQMVAGMDNVPFKDGKCTINEMLINKKLSSATYLVTVKAKRQLLQKCFTLQ